MKDKIEELIEKYKKTYSKQDDIGVDKVIDDLQQLQEQLAEKRGDLRDRVNLAQNHTEIWTAIWEIVDYVEKHLTPAVVSKMEIPQAVKQESEVECICYSDGEVSCDIIRGIPYCSKCKRQLKFSE